MDLIVLFLTTFLLVFIGELGDKTQIAAGTGTLANQRNTRIIFLSSALALITVAGLTVFFAGLIPKSFVPTIVKVGGVLLVLYGVYLYRKINSEDSDDMALEKNNGWLLFFSHFTVVFIAELGDKTQMVTLAVAIENKSFLLIVFAASATALVTVTAITIWGVTKLPDKWLPLIQKAGAVGMILYGLYMLI